MARGFQHPRRWVQGLFMQRANLKRSSFDYNLDGSTKGFCLPFYQAFVREKFDCHILNPKLANWLEPLLLQFAHEFPGRRKQFLRLVGWQLWLLRFLQWNPRAEEESPISCRIWGVQEPKLPCKQPPIEQRHHELLNQAANRNQRKPWGYDTV